MLGFVKQLSLKREAILRAKGVEDHDLMTIGIFVAFKISRQ